MRHARLGGMRTTSTVARWTSQSSGRRGRCRPGNWSSWTTGQLETVRLHVTISSFKLPKQVLILTRILLIYELPRRVLHGRQSFKVTEVGQERIMDTSYADWQHFQIRLLDPGAELFLELELHGEHSYVN